MDACRDCMGTGLDPRAPSRLTPSTAPKRSVLALLRACKACEGRGVVPRCELPAGERDLLHGPVLS